MIHRTDVLLLYTEEIGAELGMATDARAAWAQLEDGVWEAQGMERWCRVRIC